jgi:CRP-like cAMP-binding protein
MKTPIHNLCKTIPVFQSLEKRVAEFKSGSLTVDEQEIIREAFKFKKIRKHQYISHEGDICKYIIYINTGALRMYAVNERGVEHTMQLATEMSFLYDYESFTMLVPSKYYIQALEDSDVLFIRQSDFHYLLNIIPAVAEMVKHYDMMQLIATQNRIFAAISMGAEDRYHQLIANHPEYGQRFSLSMLASYLGLSPETLSRVRKGVSGRSQTQSLGTAGQF